MSGIPLPKPALLVPPREPWDDPEQLIDIRYMGTHRTPLSSNVLQWTSLVAKPWFFTFGVFPGVQQPPLLGQSQPSGTRPPPSHKSERSKLRASTQQKQESPSKDDLYDAHLRIPCSIRIPNFPTAPAFTLGEDAHDRRMTEIKEMLKPLFKVFNSHSAFTLLCIGNPRPGTCDVLVVSMKDQVDDVANWREIRRTWYEHRGRWSRMIPFYGVKKVSMTKNISLVGQLPKNTRDKNQSNMFVGSYVRENLGPRIKRLQAEVSEYTFSCSGYDPVRENFKYHDDPCDDEWICEGWRYLKNKKELCALEGRDFLTAIFFEPALAKGNNSLSGFDVGGDLELLNHLNVWRRPALHDLRFKGLVIDEGWILPPPSASLGIIGLVICCVILAKFAFGSWDAAWSAAGCVVTLVTFLYFYAN